MLVSLFVSLFDTLDCPPVLNDMHACAAARCGGLKGLLVVQSAGGAHQPVGGRPKVDAYPDCDWLHAWKADLWWRQDKVTSKADRLTILCFRIQVILHPWDNFLEY